MRDTILIGKNSTTTYAVPYGSNGNKPPRGNAYRKLLMKEWSKLGNNFIKYVHSCDGRYYIDLETRNGDIVC